VGEPERLPDLRDVLAASDSGWRRLAACRDEPDDRLFLSDKTLPHNQPGSPSILLALLMCAGCPVRRECLLEAMTPIVSPFHRWDPETEKIRESGPHRVMLGGVWGGTTEAERVALGDVPIGKAVERLERSFPVRLATVARVFERSRARRVAKSGRAARARDLLAKPEVAVLLAVTRRRCVTCSRRLPALARSDARYCSVRCRVATHRARAA
jgi:Transcription factor WhiB